MAYWLKQKSGPLLREDDKSFYCDYRSDIGKLPKNGIEGERQEDDKEEAYKPCSFGSDVLCLEDTSVWVLGKATNEWKEITKKG